MHGAVALLLKRQDRSGGWGWSAGDPANTECTALSTLALHGAGEEGAAGMRMGAAWLRSAQKRDGSWAMNEQVAESSWMTSLGVVALDRLTREDGRAVAGGRWLLGQESGRQPLLVRALMRLFRVEQAVEQDPNIIAWGWNDGTTAWVEPTSWALLALRPLERELDGCAVRIADAERMLVDRACVGGGWNYGNRTVLGADLPPYADTTAVALMALAGSRSASTRDVVSSGLVRLREMADGHVSTLALALTCIALRMHGEREDAYRDRLNERFASRREVDTRTAALTAIATNRDMAFTRAGGQ